MLKSNTGKKQIPHSSFLLHFEQLQRSLFSQTFDVLENFSSHKKRERETKKAAHGCSSHFPLQPVGLYTPRPLFPGTTHFG